MLDSCPKNYAGAIGDVIGGGLDGGLSAETIDICKDDCEARSDCFSFLYSAKEKHCKVMKERHPTSSTALSGYQFCKRPSIRMFTLMYNIEVYVRSYIF